jgi:hypothetical protein
MARWSSWLALVAAFIFNSAAHADGGVALNVDLRDMVRFNSTDASTARSLLELLEKNKEKLLGNKVLIPQAGVSIDIAAQKDLVYGIEAQSIETDKKHISLKISVLVGQTNLPPRVQFFTAISKDNGRKWKIERKSLHSVLLQNMKFSLRVGLTQRLAVLENTDYGYKKLYPLGVGSLDERQKLNGALIDSMTPRVSRSIVDVANSQDSRTTPSYYAGRPFVRITDDYGRFSPIGFHYGFQDPIFRGFQSHGCMRMQEKDLYELWLIAKTVSAPIAVKIRYSIDEKQNHPLPVVDVPYQRIKNFGTDDAPVVQPVNKKLLIF